MFMFTRFAIIYYYIMGQNLPTLNLPTNTGLSFSFLGFIPPLIYQGDKEALHNSLRYRTISSNIILLPNYICSALPHNEFHVICTLLASSHKSFSYVMLSIVSRCLAYTYYLYISKSISLNLFINIFTTL